MTAGPSAEARQRETVDLDAFPGAPLRPRTDPVPDDRAVADALPGGRRSSVGSPTGQAGALAVAALAVVGATAVGWRWAGRPPAVRSITMGPGGWVSFKGLKPARVSAPKPWWARVLRAERATR